VGDGCGYLPDDPGFIAQLGPSVDPTLADVGQLIREAIVGELREPKRRTFDHFMAQIRIKFPKYQTFDRCEFPHPEEHEHEFPYPDGIVCLAGELAGVVSSMLQVPAEEIQR
jgi:hypothetical protein